MAAGLGVLSTPALPAAGQSSTPAALEVDPTAGAAPGAEGTGALGGAPAAVAPDEGVPAAPGGGVLADDRHIEALPSEVVTVGWVLDEVAERSPLVAVGDGAVLSSELRRLEARYARFPRLRVSAGLAPAPRVELEYSEELGALDPLSNRSSDSDLLQSILGGAGAGVRVESEAVVPLTTFGKVRLATQLADIGVDVARVERDVAVRASQVHALRALLSVQWYEEIDRILGEAERRLDEAEARLEARLDDGDFAARTTLRQLTVGRADFVALRADADGLVTVARHGLATVLGLPRAFRVEQLSEEDPGVPPALDEVLAFARTHRADASLLAAAIEAAELEARVRRRALTPDIALSVNLGGAYTPTVDDVSGPFISDPYNRFGFGFAVGLQWSMNPAVMVARARRADAEVAVARGRRDVALLSAETEIVEAYTEATGWYARRQAEAEALDAARAALNQVSFQYDQGLAEYEALKEPLETYYRTAGDYYESVLRLWLALADLALDTGADALDAWPGE